MTAPQPEEIITPMSMSLMPEEVDANETWRNNTPRARINNKSVANPAPHKAPICKL